MPLFLLALLAVYPDIYEEKGRSNRMPFRAGYAIEGEYIDAA